MQGLIHLSPAFISFSCRLIPARALRICRSFVLEGFDRIREMQVPDNSYAPQMSARVMLFRASRSALNAARFRRSIPTRRSPLFCVCSTTRSSISSLNTPGIEPLHDTGFHDLVHFVVPIRGKIDLGGAERRRHPCVHHL